MNSRTHIIMLFSLLLPFAARPQGSDALPRVPREMRAAWVATVANIDWPSRPGLPVDDQKKEALLILERLKELNMNAVVLQVRPQADALYSSEFEPWSYYLTGEQGKAPEPFYDPLAFWITEAHARGIELHAWLNPYRAMHPAQRGNVSEKSILKTKPYCVRKLGSAGYYWMDPAMKEVQDHSFAVVMDIVKRYDVDAIHFDDYFYPYPDYNEGKDFPDSATYTEYKKTGGKMNLGDWRRAGVNAFVKRVYEGIRKAKPSVKFGISPFGIYRPGYPESIRVTFDQYSTLYADARLWLNKGWVDYYAPQLYWQISRLNNSFPVLLGWWKEENTKHRHLWPGLFIRPEVEKKAMALEIVNQVMVTRGMVPESPGVMHFSMASLMLKDSAVNRALREGPYAEQALMPPYPWLKKKAPRPPDIAFTKEQGEVSLTWSPHKDDTGFVYVLYLKEAERWRFEILPAGTRVKAFPAGKISAFAVSAVDRWGNESKKKMRNIE